MADLSPQDMATKLLSDNFAQSAPSTDTLTDPIVDTPMVVTLDQLRPYELDPRITRNPLFDDIKASIRERGMDAPPPITRRPGADHYIIRNGGNTRLSILRELWTETREEQFFRINCLFRPWPERGDIITLTGHLAENELHGGLSFIERALGVAKVRELYEQDGKSLSQAELARRLKADGYPVPQPHISRMQEAIQYLLPAIPTVLYGGLGRPQIEHLTSLRRAATRVWEARAAGNLKVTDFATVFQDVLASFDGSPRGFSVDRVQDELIGQMVDLLGEKYDTLEFEITDSEKRWQLLSGEAEVSVPPSSEIELPSISAALTRRPSPPPSSQAAPAVSGAAVEPAAGVAAMTSPMDGFNRDGRTSAYLDLASPVDDTPPLVAGDRVQAIQRLIADQMGEDPSTDKDDASHLPPDRADALFPVSNVWHIDPGLDTPERLRVHIAQLAREVADEAGLAGQIVPCDDGIGFSCVGDAASVGDREDVRFSRTVLALLHVLSAPYHPQPRSAGRIETLHLASDIGLLLLGSGKAPTSEAQRARRLDEEGLIKLFRLVRLARRLIEQDASEPRGEDAMIRS